VSFIISNHSLYYIIIIIINIECHKNAIRKGQQPLYRTEALLDGSQMSNDKLRHLFIWHLFYLALFIYIGRMPFLTPTVDNNYPLFTLEIAPCLYMHHVEVADQDPAIGVYMQKIKILLWQF